MNQVAALKDIIGSDYVITEREQMRDLLTDQTTVDVSPKPAENVIVVKPGNTGEVSAIMKMANCEKIPVYVRGGGTGISGAAVPIRDGILMSMERMNHVIEIDTENLMAVVEAGVALADIIKSAETKGLFFPPHPGDEGAQAGGIVALNAGGTRAVKYGVVRNYVKGLEVVLPSGEVMNLGGKLLKNNTGPDLLHLFINSGGIFGIITKVILRLYPKFESTATLLVSYDGRYDALNTVPHIIQSGVEPLAIEYMERDVIDISCEYLNMTWPATKGFVFLMAILVGKDSDDVYSQAEKIEEICQQHGAVHTIIAETNEEQAHILKIRSEIYSSLRDRLSDLLDVTVPPASIPKLMDIIDKIEAKYNTKIYTFGHAADGNLHPHLLHELVERGVLKQVKREIYKAAIDMGGVISGEHGIGLVRLPDLDLDPNQKGWELIRGIKKVFDPNDILNPGIGLV